MTTQDYVRDISQYLKSGHLSDLTLRSGEKTWQIHKNIAGAHSKWFHNACNVGFKESDTGVITLHDDAIFADAIDCMVAYFYEADYRLPKTDAVAAVLHAQVLVIADKYDCATLCRMALEKFHSAIRNNRDDTWIEAAGFIYPHTTAEVPNHKQLRAALLAVAATNPHMVKRIQQTKGFEDFLLSNGDLAIDLLRGVTEQYCKRFK